MTTPTLPRLNPMEAAPRDGTRILAMRSNGATVAVKLDAGNGQWVGQDDEDRLWWARDRDLLGWWHMPALAPVEPESPWLLGETFPLVMAEGDYMRPMLEKGWKSRQPIAVMAGWPKLLVGSCSERLDASPAVYTYLVRVVKERE